MNNLTYLFAAYAIIWAGVLAYLIRLAGLRRRLEDRVDRLWQRVESRGPHDA